MTYLVDTNILLRLADRAHERYPLARAAVQSLRHDKHSLRATSQNFAEFWNVATRPRERNGLGFTPRATDRLLRFAERNFPLLPDSPAIYPEWRRIVADFRVAGVQVHDARLVAFMRVYQVKLVLTFNFADFKRYEPLGILAVDPQTLSA